MIKYIDLFISPMIIIWLNITDFSLISIIMENNFLISNKLKRTLLNSKTSIDIAIFILLAELFIMIFKKPGEFRIGIRNRDRTDRTIIPLGTVQSNKRLTIEINIDFKWLWLKKLLNYLGGLSFRIYNTDWTSIEINHASDYKKEAIDTNSSSEYIEFNLIQMMGIKEKRNTIYIDSKIISNSLSARNGTLHTELVCKGNNMLKNIVIKLIKLLFFNKETTEHKILSRE